MKKIVLTIATIFIISCSENKKEIDSGEFNEFLHEANLDYNSEKIEILSIIYGIQNDTLNSAISDYLISTPQGFRVPSKHDKKIEYIKIIDSLSSRYKINKTDFAKIIYDYKFKNKDEE